MAKRNQLAKMKKVSTIENANAALRRLKNAVDIEAKVTTSGSVMTMLTAISRIELYDLTDFRMARPRSMMLSAASKTEATFARMSAVNSWVSSSVTIPSTMSRR
eukprot:Amastigsp_a16083_2.p3 type:complete len:104 gc:universal Amastigsp_a16083_2:126-437(+)